MYNLTGSQQNIFLSEQRVSGLPVNTLHTTITFLEQSDVCLLKKSVDFVIESADVFRLKLSYQDGQMAQGFESLPGGTCTVDTLKYTSEQLDAVFAHRKVHVFNINESLYDFIVYQKSDGTCILSILTHHIMIDGYGIGILCDEIVRVYSQMRNNIAPANETLPFEYSIKQEPEQKEDADFWDAYFDGYEIGTQPFISKSRCVLSSSFQGRIQNAEILRFCKEHSVTPYTVFVAALSLYSMKIYQSDESIVIVPRLNREPHELKTIGDFVLPVPMRVKKSSDFITMCRQIREEGKRVTVHKKYNYSQIIEDFKKRFNTDRPISDFTLNFQLADVKGEVKTKVAFSACGAMSNLVTLNISNYEGDDSYDVTYDYRNDVLNERYMEFFHNSLMQILRKGISGNKIDEINIITDQELAFLNSEFKGNQVAYGANETIVSLFWKAVRKTPDGTAVIASNREKALTFAEIDEISNRIANALIEKGVERGSLVAFLLRRDSTLIPAMLGILKAGCAFLPLDMNYPKGRIDYIIQNSKAKLIISDAQAAEEFDIHYTDINELTAHDNAQMPAVPITQNDLAYCIYTSGTSGQPKGVLLEHKGIVNITRGENNPFNKDVYENGKGIVAIGSICFDISLFEIFVFLLNGKFVVLAPDDDLANGEQIAKLFIETNANALHCTPSRLHNYISGDLFADAIESRIEIILSAGEVLPSGLADLIINRFHVRIYNGYGPTETTIGATITDAGDRETIGRPMANTAIAILDKNREYMPFGVTGEIAVFGDGVGRGYLDNDELTAEKFVKINGRRAYLTGDLGYFTPDGRLKYVARCDNQIKLRGFRIELSEIEQCTLEYNGIDNCSVIVGELNGEQHLIMYYSANLDIDEDRLKEHLRAFLSYYMIPEVIVRLETMPVNINGKIDQEALKRLPVTISKEYVPPQTKEEGILCDAFQSVLPTERIGANDNFFEMGGTSLLAAKVMMYAKKCNVNLEYSSIFKFPTPRLLAQSIQKTKLVNYLDTNYAPPKEELYAVNELLERKTSGNDSSASVVNVFMTGATGFLGSHILKLLIEDQSIKKIYCVVRAKGKLTCEKRLKGTLFYYFGDMFSESFEERISVIDGDITDPQLIGSVDGEIDTVINCAANVAHFAYGDTLKSVNVDAVENLIDFSIKKDAALVHISTISVAGHQLKENLPKDRLFTEQNLFDNQIISNEYIYSKFTAEYMILKAKRAGLKAKIMRVGNLQGRMEDGEFQINLQENAFARQLKAYAAIGKAPSYLIKEAVNITPVDETAKAVLLLARMNDGYSVFHVINPVCVPYQDIFACFAYIQKNVAFVDGFEELINQLSRSEQSNQLVEGLLIEKSDIHLHEIPVGSDFTVHALARLGFEFSNIKTDYLENYLKALNGLGFFDEEGTI